MKKIVRRESTKPRWKTGMANAPMAKEETTMLAESHYQDPHQYFKPSHIVRFEKAHHCPNIRQIRIRPLVFRHPLNASGLDPKFADRPLDLGIRGVASDECFSSYGWRFGGIDWEATLFGIHASG